MKKNLFSCYVTPNVDLVDVKAEGILCSSQLEGLDTNEGSWSEQSAVEVIGL